MHDTRAFAPLYRNHAPNTTQVGENFLSVTVAALASSAAASTTLPGNSTGNTSCSMRIANKTSVWVHVNFGILLSNQTVRAATLNDFPIAPGSVEVVSVAPEVNACSIFADGTPSASTSVVFTRGDGV